MPQSKKPMSNPTTEPKQTMEQRFDDMWMEKQRPCNGCAVDAYDILSFIREEIKAERERMIDDLPYHWENGIQKLTKGDFMNYVRKLEESTL